MPDKNGHFMAPTTETPGGLDLQLIGCPRPRATKYVLRFDTLWILGANPSFLAAADTVKYGIIVKR